MKRDWREYNNHLIKRGELLISPKAFGFEEKHGQEKKRGRPFTYPELFIRMLLFIKFALRLPYRQMEGLAKGLFSSSGVKVPNFKTPHYRFSKMDISLESFPDPEELPDDFVIILDSTGVKVTNRGEWLRKKHGKRSRKGWIKLHVAFDLKRKKVIELEVTDERIRDFQKAKRLVEGAKKEAKGKRVSKVIADAGYDSHEFFRYLGKEGIEAAVLVRKGAKIRGNAVRDTVVRAIRRGKRKWKRAVGYGKRWFVESFFSVFKRWFGEYVSSLRFENMKREIVFKVGIVNMFLICGML